MATIKGALWAEEPSSTGIGGNLVDGPPAHAPVTLFLAHDRQRHFKDFLLGPHNGFAVDPPLAVGSNGLLGGSLSTTSGA
ncbi:MAG TPA: hypothetical protein VNA87_07245 [Actinomycetota bacterium]|nr:hypothetical protein [Actinomycetota bacterium]